MTAEVRKQNQAEQSDQISQEDRPPSTRQDVKQPPIWWSNAIFFVSMHVMTAVGVYYSPWHSLDYRSAWLCFASWQLATYGITMGYHRLWSHRAYSARMPLRILLAGMGCLGFQGSIKWWVLRHRLHHRWTDTDSDPYDAQRGLIFSHVGWIFYKPQYPKLALIEKQDLDADPVVRFQHKHYLPLTLFLGLILPTLIGWTWGDAFGGYVWGGLVARLLIWHCTFCINSLAHYLGEQHYSEELSARGNFLLALITGGEASHNYHHAFPNDFRNGPRKLDFDPTKWLIWACSVCTNQAYGLHRTHESEILRARARVLAQRADKQDLSSKKPASDLPVWRQTDVQANVANLTKQWLDAGSLKRPLVIVLDGHAVECSAYTSEHPGGYAVLRKYAIKQDEDSIDASDAFHGGLNTHREASIEKMHTFRIARIEG